MEEVDILMDLNRALTLGKEINSKDVKMARTAAEKVTTSGYFTFKENTSDIEFFKEIQRFANSFRNL